MPTIVRAKAETAASPVSGTSARAIACRVGYAAHGAVYLLVGVIAIDAAFSGGEQAQGQRGAISELASGAFGTVLLTLLAIGLPGYAFMRLWQGLANPANHDNNAKGIGIRLGRIASGLTQGFFAFYALSIAYGWFGGASQGGASAGGQQRGGSGGAADLTGEVMSWPGGRWIVGVAGAAICIAALVQLGKAVKASFLRDLRIEPLKQKWVTPLGRVGFAARFVVFVLVGGFVIAAAAQSGPERAKGLGGALRTLQDQAYGPWLLGLVGVGLVCFAVIRGVYARYATIPDQRERD